MHVCVCVCVCVCVHACTCVCVSVCLSSHLPVYLCVCAYEQICMCMHAYVSMFICVFMCVSGKTILLNAVLYVLVHLVSHRILTNFVSTQCPEIFCKSQCLSID